jgi:hypothetical protein
LLPPLEEPPELLPPLEEPPELEPPLALLPPLEEPPELEPPLALLPPELARPPEALLPPWPGLPPEEFAPPEFEPPLAGGGLLVVGEHPKAKSAKESPKAPTAYGLERWELSLCMVRSCSLVRPG